MIDSAIDAPPPCAVPNTFGPEVTFPLGAAGVALAVDTLDQGANVDVAVAVTTELVILHGDGMGGFANPTTVATPASGVAVEDFDADGDNDLILWSGDTIVEHRQATSPNGTFLAAQPLTGPFQNVQNVVIEEFDGGSFDLILQDELARREFSSSLGSPGTFTRTTNVLGSAGDVLVFAGDLNKLDRADVALVDQAGNVKISLISGTGNFGTLTTIATGATGHAAAFGTFDGDALLDLVIATPAGGVIFTQNAGAPGTFTQRAGTIPGVVGTTLLIADINADGTDDIVAPGSIVLQCPAPSAPGVFTQVESLNSTQPAVLKDVNKNGKPDLLRLVGTDLVVRLQ